MSVLLLTRTMFHILYTSSAGPGMKESALLSWRTGDKQGSIEPKTSIESSVLLFSYLE